MENVVTMDIIKDKRIIMEGNKIKYFKMKLIKFNKRFSQEGYGEYNQQHYGEGYDQQGYGQNGDSYYGHEG